MPHEASLRRLRTDVIDLYYLQRWDKQVPIEDSMGALGELVREGKVQTIGLSKVSSATLRRAHAAHPIAMLRSEYLLWSREAELGTLDACRELGIACATFGPLARGHFTASLLDVASRKARDIRRGPCEAGRNLEGRPVAARPRLPVPAPREHAAGAAEGRGRDAARQLGGEPGVRS